VDSKSRTRWPGGYVTASGSYVIEKKVQGLKFHVSTRAHTLRGALKQLERFEADPRGYRPAGSAQAPLALTEALIEEYFTFHCAKAGRKWALNVKNVLIDWANHLKGKDLRQLDLVVDVKPHLVGKGQRHHRVKAIRGLMKWLRQERGALTRAQDATLDLPVPIIKPRQNTGKSKAVPWAYVTATLPHLPPHVADVLELLAAVGWHVAEVRRFAAGGTVRVRTEGEPAHVVGVAGVLQKSGHVHLTALLHPRHLAAAQRIRARGCVIGDGRLEKYMRRAIAKANALAREADAEAKAMPDFQCGDMRASVASWLNGDGVSTADQSKYLGHLSATTTKRHYITNEVPPIYLPPRVLRVV
jgi:integrase